MEASTLSHAAKRSLFSRPAPLLKLQGDEGLVALTRGGDQAAFEALVTRYQPRLLGFCRQMLRSTEDAEDILQEVFVAAHRAMLADERKISVRPWLYRIARNRCLNHLRRPVHDGQDSMDVMPIENGASVLDRVQNREDFRELVQDVKHLPETQRSALLLREMDAMSYEEIAQAMDTTVPGVKSLLVRARIALAESSQARALTCDEVKVELAEAAEGLAKASGPVRRHVRDCAECKGFRDQLRSDSKALAALFPVPALLLLKGAILGKLGLGGGGGAASAGGAAAAAGGSTAAAGGALGGATAIGGATAAGAAGGGLGVGTIGAAVGSKVGVGMVSAALLTAGAAEIKHVAVDKHPGATVSRKHVIQAPPAAQAPLPAAIEPATPVADPAGGEPVENPGAAPGEVVVEPVPVDPSGATTGADGDIASGGITPHSKKAKHRRKGAGGDRAPASASGQGAATAQAPSSEPAADEASTEPWPYDDDSLGTMPPPEAGGTPAPPTP